MAESKLRTDLGQEPWTWFRPRSRALALLQEKGPGVSQLGNPGEGLHIVGCTRVCAHSYTHTHRCPEYPTSSDQPFLGVVTTGVWRGPALRGAPGLHRVQAGVVDKGQTGVPVPVPHRSVTLGQQPPTRSLCFLGAWCLSRACSWGSGEAPLLVCSHLLVSRPDKDVSRMLRFPHGGRGAGSRGPQGAASSNPSLAVAVFMLLPAPQCRAVSFTPG